MLQMCPRLEKGQPRYLMTRNIKTHVSSIPPIMMNLSWPARLSISLITVLDSPNMLATSSIFLWVPCAQPRQSSHVLDWDITTSKYTHKHNVFWRMKALCDDIVIIQTNSSDFGRRVIANAQPDAPLRHKVLMARNKTHPDKRRPEAKNQEDHLLPGNKDSP